MSETPITDAAEKAANDVFESTHEWYEIMPRSTDDAYDLARTRECELSTLKTTARSVMEGLRTSNAHDAPGHCHTKPGRWDSDGAECLVCTNWNKLKGLVRT